jgi:hypothetical protein
MTQPDRKWTFETLPDWLQDSIREATAGPADHEASRPTPERIEWPLLVDAAVVSGFAPKDLAPGVLTGDAREEAERSVLTFSETTHQEEGLRWSLTPESRKAVLQQANQGAVHEAIGRTTRSGRFADPVTRALQLCLEKPSDVGRSTTLPVLEATRVAVSWLSGVSWLSLPRLDDLDRRINLNRLLSEFQRMVGVVVDSAGTAQMDRFFGRDEEMEKLRSYIGTVPAGSTWQAATRAISGLTRRFSAWTPMTLWGIGGVGKTTLVSKFMLEHVESAASHYPFAYLDFDRSTVSPRYRERLLAEICTQVSAQFPEIAERLQAIQTEALKLARIPAGTLEGAPVDQLRDLTQQFRALIDDHLTSIEGRFATRPFLLVFDTFEVVQYDGRDVILLEEFVSGFSLDGTPWPRLRLVISGRQEVARFLGELEPMRLEGLLLDGAAAMLQTLARDAGKTVTPQQCNRIVSAVAEPGVDGRRRVSPLRIRLLAEEFRARTEDGPTIAQSLIDELSQPLDQNGRIARLFIDGILIRRVLRHVADRRVQALADPGLVVRRFDADVIREVMTAATPKPGSPEDAPQPWVVDQAEAQSIFEIFKKEVSLVEGDGTFLRHRADVRREMLPLIRVKSRRQFDDLHARAFAYFDRLARQRPRDLILAAEALYHALWLDKPMAEWLALWRPDAAFQPRVDPEEFEDGTPPHVFLRAKRYDKLSVGEVRSLPPELALEWLERRSMKLLDASRVYQEIDALGAAMGKDFEALDRAPEAAAPSARLLVRSGRWDDALRLTDRQHSVLGESVLIGAARSVTTYVDGASDANSMRLSLLRTEATVSAKSGRNGERPAPLNAAMATADPVIRVELLAYRSLGLPPTAEGQGEVMRMIDNACRNVGRDRWLKNPRILRLAVLTVTDADKLLPIQVETMAGLPRDRAALASIELVIAAVAQKTGSDNEVRRILDALREAPGRQNYVALDAQWRDLKGEAPRVVLGSAAASRAFREVVVFDHSDWILPLGNALSRALRQSEADVVREVLRSRQFGRGATRGDEGIAIVQAIAAEGRLLELAAAIHERQGAIQQWSSDSANNGIAGLSTALLVWHTALLMAVQSRGSLPERDLPPALVERASSYLQPEPLNVSQRHLDAIAEELRKQPLRREQIEMLLRGNGAAERIVGYRQLQMQPDPDFNQTMFDVLEAELRLAESLGETRPLWNWLEVFHQRVYKAPHVPHEDRDRLVSAVDRIMTFLRLHPQLDMGRHCLQSAQSLRGKLDPSV